MKKLNTTILHLSNNLARRCLTLLFFLLTMGACAAHQFTLVIDAGHGGHDTGAPGASSLEKNINLNVALAFGKWVEQQCPDVKVIYTRKTDVFVPLQERANIANRNNADLFISVHTNALPAGKIARGFETYTLGMHRAKDNLDVAMRENSVISMEKGYKQTYKGFDPNSSESYIMFEFIQGRNMEKSVDVARMIQRSVCSQTERPDKGVHQAGFLVLRETSMPSCLIELGFITTPDEEAVLNNPTQVDAIGKAICTAFKQYKDKYYNNITVPYKSDTTTSTVVPQLVEKPYQPVRRNLVNRQPANRKVSKQINDNSTKTRPAEQKRSSEKITSSKLVYKVQIFTTNRKLRPGDAHFKGEENYDYFTEGGLLKYTIGNTTSFSEISKLRKELSEKFPQCFIITFKNGQKVNAGSSHKTGKATN